jgi:hypothetical protein
MLAEAMRAPADNRSATRTIRSSRSHKTVVVIASITQKSETRIASPNAATASCPAGPTGWAAVLTKSALSRPR